MTLEFSAPRELHKRRAGENGATLTELLEDGGPAGDSAGADEAGAAEWRHRGDMLARRMCISAPTTITCRRSAMIRRMRRARRLGARPR